MPLRSESGPEAGSDLSSPSAQIGCHPQIDAGSGQRDEGYAGYIGQEPACFSAHPAGVQVAENPVPVEPGGEPFSRISVPPL